MEEKTTYHKYVNYAQIVYISLYLVGLDKTWHTDQKVRMEEQKARTATVSFENKEQGTATSLSNILNVYWPIVLDLVSAQQTKKKKKKLEKEQTEVGKQVQAYL